MKYKEAIDYVAVQWHVTALFTSKTAGVTNFHINVQNIVHIRPCLPIILCMSFRNRSEPYFHAIRVHSIIAIMSTDQLAAYLSISCSQYIPL